MHSVGIFLYRVLQYFRKGKAPHTQPTAGFLLLLKKNPHVSGNATEGAPVPLESSKRRDISHCSRDRTLQVQAPS